MRCVGVEYCGLTTNSMQLTTTEKQAVPLEISFLVDVSMTVHEPVASTEGMLTAAEHD